MKRQQFLYQNIARRDIKQLVRRVCIVLIASIMFVSQPVSAALNYEYRVLQDQLWYDECGGGSSSSSSDSSSSGGAADLTKVYILGDSISVGATTEYEKQLKEAGAKDVKVSASTGGNLTNAGTTGTMRAGIDSLKADSDYLKSATTIVIEIGTNQMTYSGGSPGSSSYIQGQQAAMKDALAAIPSDFKGKIFWVDVAISSAAGSNVQAYAGPINKAIYSYPDKKFSTISWAKAVDSSVDPANQTGPVKDSGHKLGDGIHPVSPAEYATNLVNGLKGGGSGGSSSSSSGTSSSSASSTSSSSGSSTDSSGSDSSSGGATTKKDKIAKLLIPIFNAGDKAGALTAIEKYKFGGMAMTGDGRAFDKAFFTDAKSKAGGQFVPMADEEGGGVSRYGIESMAASQMARLSDEDVKKEGQKTGEGLKGYGIEVDLAPVLDIEKPGLNNHLRQGMNGQSRAFGTTDAVVTAKAGNFAAGLSAAGIKPTYKHFPGLGQATAHTDFSPATLDYNNLQNDLKPFKALANQNSGLVMISNAMITGLGGGNSGLPAPMNPALIQKLRGEVGFNGAAISDDLSAITKWPGQPDLPTVIVNSLKAGTDLMLFAYPGDAVIDQIIDKVDKEVPDARIDEAYGKYQSVAGAAQQTSSDSGSDSCCGSGSSGDSGSSTAGGGGGGGCGEQGYGSGKRDSKANKDQIWSFFKNKGLTDEAAAGIMGNMKNESAFMPDAENSIGCRGVVQWCPGSKITNYAQEHGKDWTCLGTQLEFLWMLLTEDPYESKVKDPFGNNLGGKYGVKVGDKLIDSLNKIKDPGVAAMFFEEEFERSNHNAGEQNGRDTSAKEVYKEYTGKDASPLGGDSGSCSSSTDSSVPPADCGSTVEEMKKLLAAGKIKSINGPQNLDDDMAHCGKVDSGPNCVGVNPEILRVAIGLTKFIDSKGLGPVTFANFNKGHDCDGGKHTHGNAFDLWYGACDGEVIYTKPACVESVKWLLDNNKEYDIGAALHNPVALKGLPNNESGGNKDGVQLYLSSEGEMIHTSTGKDGRW